MATLAPRRLASRVAIFAAIGLVSAVTSGFVTAGTSSLATARVTGARELLAGAPADAASVVVTTHLSDSPTAQDAAVEALVARRFAGVPVTVTRTTTAAPLTTATGGRVLVGSDAAITSVAHLVAGTWLTAPPADGAVPAVVQADAAAALHLRVGDELTVPGSPAPVTLVIRGTWRPDDPTAVRWHGDSAAASGYSGGDLGPFLVDETAMTSLPTDVYVRWVVAPVVAKVTAASLARLSDAATVDSMSTAIARAGSITDQSTTVTGGLASTAARATRVIQAAGEIAMLPMLLGGIVALITLVQLAGLLASTRAGETTTLRARGTSVSQLTGWAVAESSVVVVPAVLVGWALGGAGSAARGPAALVALLAVTATSARAHAAVRELGPSRERWRVLGALAVLIVLVAAGLASWQLRLDDGGALAGWAAPLDLVSLCLVGAGLLGPVAALAARRLASLRGLAPVLAARQVARQVRVFAVVTLVLALASGGVSLAGALAATTSTADARTSASSVGTDVRVRLAVLGVVSGRSVPITAVPYGAIVGVDSAAVVLATTASVGSDRVDVVAAAAGVVPVVMVDGAEVDGHALVGSTRRPPLPALTAPEVALEVSVGPDAVHRTGEVAISTWVMDAQGALAQVELGSIEVAEAARAPVRLEGTLPPGVGAWSLLAVDADLVGSPGPDLRVSFTGAAPLDAVTVSSSSTHARSMAVPAPAARMPIIVSDALARRSDLAVGSPVTLDVSAGLPIDAVVTGTTARVPGAGSPLAVMADLPTLDSTSLAGGGPVLQPAEIWIATHHPAEVGRESSTVSRLPSHVTSAATASVGPVIDPVRRIVWAGVRSSALSALIALAAVAVTLVRSRRHGSVVLRASGMSTGAQMRLRAAELVGVSLFGIVTGALAGVGAARLCVLELARSAVPGAQNAVIVLGWGATVPSFAFLAGGLAVIAGGYVWAVRRTMAGGA